MTQFLSFGKNASREEGGSVITQSRRNHIKMLALAGLTTMAGGCAGLGASDRITLAHTADEQHPVHLAMKRFRDELVVLSGGTMAVEIFPNAQLGTERELVELVQLGAISMTKVSSLSLENFSPDMGVYSLPYLFDDSEHQRRVVESDIGREILSGLETILLKGMGYYDAGARSFYMTDGPVNTPEDIRGKTLRVLPSEALVKTIETFGGAATPIAFGELYAALQQGVVQGAENNPPSVLNAKHHEVCKFYSLDEHVSAPDVVVMSQSVWDGLSPQQREWAEQAMAASETYQRKLWREASDAALAEIKASGVAINRPDKAPFRAAVAELKASYDGTRVGDLAKRIEAMSESN